MDINELETYRLSDAIKYHDRLNPRLWGADEHLLPEVRAKLLEIAQDFQEFLGVNVDVQDITISGSNAAYTYTDHSDIDLHLVVDLPRADTDAVYRELFDAKKYQYNDRNDFRIAGYDVELYVQDPRKPHHSQGIYSVKNDEWIDVPKRRKPQVDDVSVRSKYEDLGARIESAIESGDLAAMDTMATRIKEMRQAGLDQHGEFGAENLAFKILRNNGTLQKLSDARKKARDARMSLDERKRKKSRKRKRYAYGGYWYPGYHYYGDTAAAADGGGDGGGGESVRESQGESQQDVIQRFARSCADFLGMENPPQIKLRQDPEWTRRNGTFGRYTADPYHRIEIATHGRHIIDILRTLAHEMTHARQEEVMGLPDNAGETGSRYEDQANAMAGQIMRHWADSEPELFQGVELEEQLDRATPSPESIIKRHGIDEKQLIDQLTKGIAVEMEHTRDPRVALEIALDHLNERPDYYDMLSAVERPMAEGLREKIAGLAAAACIAGTPGCATTKDALKTVQTIGRVAKNLPTRAGAEEELRQAVKDQLRRQRGEVVPENIAEASGYIPTEKEKDDPRYSMALTQDIRPGEIGRQANRLGLKTDSQGRPQLLMRKLENLLESIKAGDEVNVPGQKSSFVWSDYNELPMSSVMDLAESWFLGDANLLESNSPETRKYFQGMFSMGITPEIDSSYLMTLLILINDRVSVAQDPVMVRVVDRHGPNEYTVEMPDGRRAKFPYQVLRDRAVYNTWFFDSAQDYDKFRSAVSLKFSVDLPRATITEATMTATVQALYREMWAEVEDLIAARQNAATNPHHIQSLEARIQEIQQELAGEGYRFDYTTGRLQALDESRDLFESEDLFEVKMRPSELKKWASSEEAQGIRAGFEAELIFRDTSREESRESEPDYDQDERTRDIDQVVDFFQGGENGITRAFANRLRDRLYEEFHEWISNTFYEDVWNESKYTEYVDDNIWPNVQDEWAERAQKELGLEDEAELTPEQIDQIAKTAWQMFREEAEEQWESQGPWYSEAEEALLDEFRDDTDEAEWLSDNYRYMSDIESEFDLDWPYWIGGEDREGGSRDPEDIADSLARNLGVQAVASSDYHRTRRRPDLWIVEPDGSLSPDDYEDTGLEVVSPPMPLPEALQRLREIIDWANGPGDAYTNDSTGLHMGVSIPYKGGDVDYVKLILFMGDQHVLEQFGRAANTYARSALEKLQDVQRQRRQNMSEADVRNMKGADKTAAAMDLMRRNLIELAARFVQDSVGQSKYTSAHIKDGYIEFRSPGGDYLSMDSRDEDALQNTMLRFARAMQIAGRPDLERKEYSKKLYKLLSGFRGAEISKTEDPRPPEERKSRVRYQTRIEYEDQNDAMDLFARYVSGQITPDELKKQWAEQVLAKELPEPRGEYEYEVVKDVSRHPDEPARREVIDIIRADGENEADRMVRDRYADEPDYYKYSAQRRRYQYEVVNRDTGEVVGEIEDINLDRAIDRAWNQYGPGGENIPFDVRERPRDEKPQKPLSRRAQIAKKIAEKPTLWTVKALDREMFVMSQNAEDAKRQARTKDSFFDRNSFYIDVRPATRAEWAEYRQQQEKPTLWHVSMGTSKSIVVKAHDQTGALQQAAQQDPYFASLNPHAQRFLQIRRATDDEVKQYRVQQADNEQDLEQIQRRVAPGRGRYLVKWTEVRDGQEVPDSIRQEANSPSEAMSSIRRALELQGRSPENMQAELVDSGDTTPPATGSGRITTVPRSADDPDANWAAVNRITNNPVLYFSAGGPNEAQEEFERRFRRSLLSIDDYYLVPVDAGDTTPLGTSDNMQNYTVSWTVRERYRGEDNTRVGATRISAASPRQAETIWMQRYREDADNPDLIDFVEVEARPTASASNPRDQSQNQREYHIYHRGTGIPAVAFRAANDEAALERLDQYRQEHPAIDVGVRRGGAPASAAAQTDQAPESDQPSVQSGVPGSGEFTGRWEIRDAQTGRVLHTIGGIGNQQVTANRYALNWLTDNGYGSGTEVEVTPEMR